jgi:hypothetical protein
MGSMLPPQMFAQCEETPSPKALVGMNPFSDLMQRRWIQSIKYLSSLSAAGHEMSNLQHP